MSTKSTSRETIRLEYDLLDLPTAQHKAGLAGLIAMIQTMQARRMQTLPAINELTATSACIEFTEQNMQALFDDLYDAILVEARSMRKWGKQEPKRIEEVQEDSRNGKTKKARVYIYDIVQPRGDFLKVLFGHGAEAWVKLWREMLWQTLRSIPRTRGVYEERATGTSSTQAQKVWRSLLKSQELKEKGKIKIESIASPLFVGSQDKNAEKVSFQGAVQHNLLLHFWTIVSLVFVPQVFTDSGEREFVGYVLAIPEPAHLKDFVEDVKELFGTLDSQVFGYRPMASLIDVTEEGGLEYLYHLARHKVASERVAGTVAGVELYHLEKRNKSIRILAAEKIAPSVDVLEQYEPLRTTCRNPFFKGQRVRNLLQGRPWYWDMEAVFNTHRYQHFIYLRDETPGTPGFFGSDVRRKLLAIHRDMNVSGGGRTMSPEELDDVLAERIYQLVGSFVRYKTETKSGKRWEDFKDKKDNDGRIQFPREYREALEKICSDAFLAMRGRREQDFVEYFSGTICSVPQFLPENDYIGVSRALITDWEKVKTLSMLALSAHSYLGKAQEGGES